MWRVADDELSDLDLPNSRIFVPNKNFKGKQETLLLTPESVNIVEQARELAKERDDEKLFSWKATNGPNRVIRRAEQSIGIKIGERGLHGFRRAFANRLFKQGMAIVDVQEIMRHKDIQTTLKYYKEFREKELLEKMAEKL
jgi:integrase